MIWCVISGMMIIMNQKWVQKQKAWENEFHDVALSWDVCCPFILLVIIVFFQEGVRNIKMEIFCATNVFIPNKHAVSNCWRIYLGFCTLESSTFKMFAQALCAANISRKCELSIHINASNKSSKNLRTSWWGIICQLAKKYPTLILNFFF